LISRRRRPTNLVSKRPEVWLCVRRHEECLERLRNFQDFPIYWLGESYEGLPLASVYQDDFGLEGARRKPQFTLEYGSCIIEAGQEGCGIPLSIFISPYCESPVDPQTIELEYQKSEIRGAAAYDHGHFLRTGSVAIGISGGGERVALNLVRANGGEPNSPEDPFDPPVEECYPASPTAIAMP
jgi:hypothetical protein